MKKCEFEDERWLRAQALLYKSRFNPAMAQNFKRCANELHRLRARVARLEEALREIRDYSAYNHPDIQVLNHRNQVIVEINECSACQHAKQVKWPPSGLCSEHYGKYHIAQRRVEEMHDYKQTWEPREIARRALEEK